MAHRTHHGQLAAGEARLAPAVDAFVGLDFDDQLVAPPHPGGEGLDVPDLHLSLLVASSLAVPRGVPRPPEVFLGASYADEAPRPGCGAGWYRGAECSIVSRTWLQRRTLQHNGSDAPRLARRTGG